jgi:glucuronosyltransferase
LWNFRYRENAQRLSRIFKDQPQKPLDAAIYWTEYVIRHRGAVHLRSGAADLNAFVYYSLDVISLLGASLIVAVYVVRKLCSIFFSRTNSKIVQISEKDSNTELLVKKKR